MKKGLVLALIVLLLGAMTACGNSKTDGAASGAAGKSAADDGRETATEYLFELAEGEDQTVENLVFEQDVTVSGDNAQITFSNCAFNGSLINTADEGTRVILAGSTLEGQCVFANSVKESTMEASFPKFLVDMPVAVSGEDCVGAVIPLGDFEITFNGQAYTMADAELYFDISDPEAGFVPYEGQQANYYCVAQWWENGEKIVMVECEYDPNM